MIRADKTAVYIGTVFPVIYWHLTPDRVFNWFIPGDFISFAGLLGTIEASAIGPSLFLATKLVFYGIWIWAPLWWFLVHLSIGRRYGLAPPTGKIFWVLGTWVNWYLGIVYFNSDLIFTITNVIAHGIPYYALIGIYAHRKMEDGGYGQISGPPKPIFKRVIFYGLFIIPILMLAMGEEYMWNFLIYREFGEFFELLWAWPGEQISSPVWTAFWIAMLSLPQVVHYLLDGFIWKFNQRNPDLGKYLFP